MNRTLHPPARRLVDGTLLGLASAAAGLAAGEIVAALSPTFQSPMLDVGDRVVDGVSQPIKQLAVDWFGTNDKRALLIGIGTLLALYAVALGVLALGRRRWSRWVPAGALLFGVAGAYASQTTRRAAPVVAVLPSAVGGVVAALAMVVLVRLRQGDARPGRSIVDAVPTDRRRFLANAGLITLAAAVAGGTARRLANRPDARASRSRVVLPSAADPLPPVARTLDTTAPGVSPFFTPNDRFYRIDTALTTPQVPVEDWRLRVHGMVDRPFTLTFDELLQREIVEADVTLTCVSNEVGGKLVGTARWLGVRLDTLLEEAGVQGTADQVVGRSVDGFTCGFPVDALDGRDALIAIGMNGEPLPLAHGFPARLVVPGLYGYVSATKWLTELELTRFDRFDSYWVRRGWADDGPIKVQSRIDTPKGLATVAAGPVVVAGVAWAQTRGIEAVEVQVDDGEWAQATLAPARTDDTWRQWSFVWQADAGRHDLTVRATERNGPIQTDVRSEPFPSGATGRHHIAVFVR